MIKRKSCKDVWMLLCVYRGKLVYEYYFKGGGVIRFCKFDVKNWEVLKVYEDVVQVFEVKENFLGLVSDFFESVDFFDLLKIM